MNRDRYASCAQSGLPLALFVVFLVLGLVPPPLNSQVTDTSHDRGSIAGTVVDAITQQPLKGSEVTLRGPMDNQTDSAQSTSADGDGRFVFNTLLPGRYIVSASHREYVLRDHEGPGGFRSRWRALLPGQQIDDLVVALLPGAVITGHVINEKGEPLRGASLHAMRVSYQRGTRDLDDVAQVPTDQAGEYRFTGLTPGSYFLHATFIPKSEARPAAKFAYLLICYPGTSDFSACMPLAVRAGEEAAGIDLHFVPVPTVHLAGQVIDAHTSLPSANAELSLLIDLSGTPVPLKDTSADAAGHFQFASLPPGTYTMVAQQAGKSERTRPAWAMKSVTVSDLNIENLKLELAPGAEVKGHVRVEGNSGPALTAMVATLGPTMSPALVALLPQVQDANVKPDGSFTFRDVPEGNYRVNAFPVPQGFYLKAADSDVLENGISISGGVGPHVELVLSRGVAKIEGRVLSNGQSCAGIPVLLVPEGKRQTQVRDYRESVSDRSCRFALRGVAPGDYKIFAWESNGAFTDPDLLRQSEDQAQSVRLKEGADLVVQLEIVSTGEHLP